MSGGFEKGLNETLRLSWHIVPNRIHKSITLVRMMDIVLLTLLLLIGASLHILHGRKVRLHLELIGKLKG